MDELTDSLWELAGTSRWFSGRSRQGRASGVEVGPWVRPPGDGPGILPAHLGVTYASGDVERYFVPLVARPAGEQVAAELGRIEWDGQDFVLGDLADDEEASGLLLELLSAGAAGFVPARDVPIGLSARRYRGEQSNTTIFFGSQLLAKLFRRLEDGRNPDVELHEALSDTGAVAELYGVWRDGDEDLAIFLEALPEPADGYLLARDHAASGTSFVAHAEALGHGLAAIHHALAERLPTSTRLISDFVAGARTRYERAAEEVPELERFRDGIEAAWEVLGDGELFTSRIHGDCHLGQVLLSNGRWVYVDFEGEPLKTIQERRAPDTPLRDVAGMLRSLHYAAATAAADGHATDMWLAEARAAFLSGYGGMGEADPALLRALEVDKAIYEVVYESRNRPAWRHVPVDFLKTIEELS